MFNHITNSSKFRATLSMAVIAVVAVGVSVPAGAKDKPLSQSDLKSLVAKAETKTDHERIARHFDAEADRYEAEAKEHGDLAVFYEKNSPNGAKYPNGMKTFQHCDSVSKSLTQAAQDSRALASEHREMAKGAK